MADKYPKLRALGDWGGRLADVLTFLTTNWPGTLATILAIGTWLNKTAVGLIVTPAIYASAGVFLAVLWTIVGLTYLYDRRKPRQVQTHLDYRYGLTFDAINPAYTSADIDIPNAGFLQFEFGIRNYSPGPIHYSLETADIRIGTRANPKYKAGEVSGYMARGSLRVARPKGFDRASLKEFYGQGLIEGTADITFTYGPPEEAPRRRLRLNMALYLSLPLDGTLSQEKGHQLGFNSSIVSEQDEPI